MMGRSTGWLGVLVMVGACTEAGGERPVSLCERYAEAAERVVGGWHEELELTVEQAEENARGHVPAVGGPNESQFYALSARGGRASEYAPWVESRCAWRELSLAVEFPDVPEYFDPEILLGSVLDGLRRKEGLDAYSDRMRVVVEDVDSGFYAAFDPGD